MNVIRYYDVEEFLQKVEPFLLKDEAANNLSLGILYSLSTNWENNIYKQDFFFGSVENEDKILLVIIMASGNLVLCGTNNSSLDEVIKRAVYYMVQAGIFPPGVIGSVDVVNMFVESWKKANNCTYQITMRQRIYRLDVLGDIKLSPGILRCANMKDVQVIANWVYDFSKEALEVISWEQAVEFAQNSVMQSSIYLWEDNIPVSMAKKARPTKNGVAVNLVYTPLGFRNRGYAKSCVYSLSRKLLNDGYKFCSLYTDLSNPISNRIYTEIGYKPIMDSIVYSFNNL